MDKKRNAFETRLRIVLAARKQYAWGESIGATRGSTNRMFKGEIPGWEVLVAISDVERTNLNWLLNGVNAPFITKGCRRYEDKCIQSFDELFQAHDDWRIHCFTQGTHYCVALTRQSNRMTRDKAVEYTEVKIIADGGGRRLLRRIEDTSKPVYRVPIASSDFERLAEGYIGNVELLEAIGRGATRSYQSLVPSPAAERPATVRPDPFAYNLGRLDHGKHVEIESMIRKMLMQQGERWEELSN